MMVYSSYRESRSVGNDSLCNMQSVFLSICNYWSHYFSLSNNFRPAGLPRHLYLALNLHLHCFRSLAIVDRLAADRWPAGRNDQKSICMLSMTPQVKVKGKIQGFDEACTTHTLHACSACARAPSEGRRARGPGRPLSLDLSSLVVRPRRAFALPRRSHNWLPWLMPWMEPERDEDVIMMNLQVMTFKNGAVG